MSYVRLAERFLRYQYKYQSIIKKNNNSCPIQQSYAKLIIFWYTVCQQICINYIIRTLVKVMCSRTPSLTCMHIAYIIYIYMYVVTVVNKSIVHPCCIELVNLTKFTPTLTLQNFTFEIILCYIRILQICGFVWITVN